MKAAKTTVLIAGLLAFLAPTWAVAAADSPSASDEYTPTLPTSGGPQPTDGIGGHHGGLDASSSGSGAGDGSGGYGGGAAGYGGGSTLPSGQELRSQGSDGANAASIAENTAPQSDALKEAIAAHADDPASTATDPSASQTISSGDSGNGSIGPALPIFLGVVLLAAVAWYAKRRFGDNTTGGTSATKPKRASGLRSVLRRS